MLGSGNRWKRILVYIVIGEAMALPFWTASAGRMRCGGHCLRFDRGHALPPQGSAPLSLPDNAVKVPGTEGERPLAPAQWRSDHEVVLLRRESGEDRARALLVDAGTGRQTRLLALEKILRGRSDQELSYATLSPDGKWLLWPGADGPRPFWTASTLDGAQRIERPMGSAGAEPTVAWLPDSRRWAELTPEGVSGRMVLHSLDGAASRSLRLDARLDGWDGLGFTGGNRGIVLRSWDGDRRVDLFDVALQENALTARPFSVVLPQSERWVNDYVPSPRGDRIAWRLVTPHKYLHPANAPFTVGVWVSDRDGSDLRPVLPDVPRGEGEPTDIHWTPDGRRIGFWRAGALWSVPAP